MADTFSAAQAGTIKVGDLVVNRIGLGTNRITDTEPAHRLLHRAVELGVNFIDTAWRYAGGQSETSIGNTLAPYPEGLVIATKGGWEDAQPEDLRANLEDSLRRLKLECIDLYQLHRVNPNVPIEESVGMLKQFQDEGKIRHIGLSEVNVEQLQRAQKVAPIVSVQNRYNVLVRTYEELVDYCTEQSIAFIPWSPLGGLGGGVQEAEAKLSGMAQKYDTTPLQLALAWLLKRSPMILPIPGTLSIDHLEQNLHATTINLSDGDYRHLLSAVA